MTSDKVDASVLRERVLAQVEAAAERIAAGEDVEEPDCSMLDVSARSNCFRKLVRAKEAGARVKRQLAMATERSSALHNVTRNPLRPRSESATPPPDEAGCRTKGEGIPFAYAKKRILKADIAVSEIEEDLAEQKVRLALAGKGTGEIDEAFAHLESVHTAMSKVEELLRRIGSV